MDGGYAEFCVKKKSEGVFALYRIIYWMFFILVPAVLIVLLFTAGQPSLLVGGSVAIVSVFVLTAVFTKKYLSIEYEYIVVGGEMNVDIIYGGKSRKNILNVVLKNVKTFAPYEEQYVKEVRDAEKIKDIRSSSKAENAYFLLFGEEKSKQMLIFEADEKAIDMLKIFCRTAMPRNYGL